MTPSPVPGYTTIPVTSVVSASQRYYPGTPRDLERDIYCLRPLLCHRLNKALLRNVPSGFPFRFVFDGQGGMRKSFDSFDFQEDLPRGLLRCSTIKISYKAPVAHSPDPRYTWNICIPLLDANAHRAAYSRAFEMARVQVHPDVRNTPYWVHLVERPHVILRALALSLELAAMITLRPATLADFAAAHVAPSPYPSSSIVYVGMNMRGESSILFFCNP